MTQVGIFKEQITITYVILISAPNTKTNVAISLSQISRMKSPYKSNCTDKYPKIFIEEERIYIPPKTLYSEKYCQRDQSQTIFTEFLGFLIPLSL